MIYNLGVGYKFSKSIRTDFNLQYIPFKYKANEIRQQFKTLAAFVNGYYDINFHKNLVPYLTAGIGIGKHNAGTYHNVGESLPGKNATNMIWNIGAGIKYDLNKNYAIDLGYKYIDLGKAKKTGTTSLGKTKLGKIGRIFGDKQKIRGHQIIGSLIYSF